MIFFWNWIFRYGTVLIQVMKADLRSLLALWKKNLYSARELYKICIHQMLKRLFTSNTRIKLLSLFLLNPDQEFFIRELTRRLEEQINSVRRELDNLKKLGLLKSKEQNRKKYYVVNKNFIAFNELRSIILKSLSDQDNVSKKIMKFGEIDVMLLSGMFVNKESQLDLLLVGKVDREKLEEFFNNELETKRPVRYSVLTKEDYVYRRQCKDKFLHDLMSDATNVVAMNKLDG